MFWPIIKQNPVNGHPGYVGKDMRVHHITTLEIEEEVLRKLNIGMYRNFCGLYNKVKISDHVLDH